MFLFFKSPNPVLNYSELFAMKLTREAFEEAAISALRGLPPFLKKKMENVDLVIEDRASKEILSEM